MITEPHIQTVKKAILRAIHESVNKLTPLETEKIVSRAVSVNKAHIKTAIKELIETGDLAYTYIHGCSFLEKSYNKPIRISHRVILTPLHFPCIGDSPDVVVRLQQGVSFGTGEHPSTRLALRGIDHVLSEAAFLETCRNGCALDIGTGSGILAIAAVLLGCGCGVGVDMDPCARFEARTNVKINSLEHRIKIFEPSHDKIKGPFSLVMSNLRYPTIRQMASRLKELTTRDALVVVSGIKVDESAALLDLYAKNDLMPIWNEIDGEWAGHAFKKNSGDRLSQELASSP